MSLQERAVRTRRRILDAAFAVLSERGFEATTSSEVCRRAGVSRGTLLHHFPTTADLVTAAAEDLFSRRLEAFLGAFATVPRERAGAAVELLWRELSGPTFYGWLEVLVRARRDRGLRAKVRGVMRRFGALVDRSFAEMFPGLETPWLDARMVPSLAFAMLHGLALDGIWERPARIEERAQLVARLAELVMSMTQTKEQQA